MSLLETKGPIFCLLALFLFFPIPGIAETNGSEAVQDELSDLDDFDDFEDFEDFSEEEIPEEVLSPETIIEIGNITVLSDGEIYANPNKGVELEKSRTKFEVLFSEIPLRQGDILSKKHLDGIIAAAVRRLNQGSYYSNAKLEYAVNQDSPSQGEAKGITLYVSVEQRYPYSFSGGNAYAGFGYKTPSGLITKYYAGANRVEANFRTDSILFQKDDGTYSRVPLIAGGKGFGYWNYLSPWSRTFLYGGSVLIGIRPIPDLRLTLKAQAVGASTYEEKVTETAIKYMGLPQAFDAGLSVGGVFRLDYRLAFKELGYYRPHIKFSIPANIGYWTSDMEEPFELYDSYGFLGSVQLAYTLFLDQAISLEGGFITNGVSNSLPYHLKANLRSGLFNSYGLVDGVSRLGSGYEYDLTVGNKGAFLSATYGITFLKTSIIAIELYGLYQMGMVADEFDGLSKNFRHTLGPGLSLFFSKPANLKASVGIGLGGTLIPGQDDGKPVSIGFSVTTY